MTEGEKHTQDTLDDEPPPTEEELRAAEALARALDEKGDPAPGSDAAFAASLRASSATSKVAPLDDATRAAIVDRAVAKGASRSRWRGGRLVLAAAAALLLAISIPVGLSLTSSPAPPPRAITYGGPSDALFDAPFPNEQRASARMDRIATARVHDYFSAIDTARGAR